MDTEQDADSEGKGIQDMNRMPQLQSGNRETKMTTSFSGYNHNEIISDGEMYEMQNLSGRLYPALAPRK